MIAARTAPSANKAISTMANRLSGFASSGPRRATPVGRIRSAATVGSTMLGPRVEPVVGDVHREIGDGVNDRGEERHAQHRGKVETDRGGRRVPAGARGRRRYEEIETAAAREPAELVVAEPDEDQPEPEDRDRPAHERSYPDDVIRQSTAKDRGPDSRRDPDEDGDRQRRERKLERRGERISQVLGNGATRADALAKIAVKNARHVNDVLLRQRPVEAVFGSELRDLRP